MLMNTMQCSRRNDKSNSTSCTVAKEVEPVTKASEKLLRASALSDVSTDDFSDNSATRSFGGRMGSDTESSDAMPDFPSGRALTAPPGLQPLLQPVTPWTNNRIAQAAGIVQGPPRSKWNAQAPPFIPGKTDAASNVGMVQKEVQKEAGEGLSSLKSALDRLTPQEIATVKSLLDNKLQVSEHGGAYPLQLTPLPPKGITAPVRSDQPLFQRLPATRRPFAPFQGGQTHAQRHNVTPTMSKDGESQDSLAAFLRELSLLDNNRVLTLRKINKLGLEPTDALQTYLSKFGPVERIMVCATPAGKGRARMRPAALGFAVMSKAEDAKAALDFGEHHHVAGADIVVAPFASHSIDGA